MASNAKGDMGVTTLSGDVLLKVYNDISPTIPPMLRIICGNGGRNGVPECNEAMIRGKRRSGESVTDWACPKCKRVIRLMET